MINPRNPDVIEAVARWLANYSSVQNPSDMDIRRVQAVQLLQAAANAADPVVFVIGNSGYHNLHAADKAAVTPGTSILQAAQDEFRKAHAVSIRPNQTGFWRDRYGVDAVIRVLLEYLRDKITPIWSGGEQIDDAVSGRHIRKLLLELEDRIDG
jgi:hypothetical protein